MKALVTGCAGFIGSSLVDKLLELGHIVTGVDCFTDYYPRHIKETNLTRAKSYTLFRLLAEDILDIDRFPDVDVVYHLAAQAGVQDSWDNFSSYIRNNIEATQRLLDAYKDNRLVRFIYASSSSVYGTMEVCSEDTTPRPESPYGMTKLAGEHLCQIYRHNYGLPTVCLRYFTVYGHRQRPDMAIHKFVNAILAGNRITVYGNGKQAKDFTYIDDVVKATIQATDSCSPGDIVNIGGGTQISINSLISLIADIIGKDAKVEYEPAQRGDVKSTLADTTKIVKTLGWKPRTPIREGLRKYIKGETR